MSEPTLPITANRLVTAIPLDDDSAEIVFPREARLASRAPQRSKLRRIIFAVLSATEWLFGLAMLIAGLAVLAATPIAQFLALGYLLEASGRVARSARIGDGFIGVRLAARLGGAVLASWLCLLPVRFISDLAYSAAIIEPGGDIARLWRGGLILLTVLTALHIIAAWSRGGRLRYFLWPFNMVWLVRRVLRGGYYSESRDAVWDTALSLRLPHYFLLGAKGFVVGLAWLVIPVSLLALGHAPGKLSPLVGVLGGVLLAVVLLYLPFLQVNLAVENRLRAGFSVRSVRAAFRRAPWAFLVGLAATLLFAVPLYLLKIEVVPREAEWLPGLVFLLFIYPARLLTGWALGRARRRRLPRHWFFRWTARMPLLPIAAAYVLVVFFSQYTSWTGVWSLYEQHAFLLPVPFFVL